MSEVRSLPALGEKHLLHSTRSTRRFRLRCFDEVRKLEYRFLKRRRAKLRGAQATPVQFRTPQPEAKPSAEEESAPPNLNPLAETPTVRCSETTKRALCPSPVMLMALLSRGRDSSCRSLLRSSSGTSSAPPARLDHARRPRRRDRDGAGGLVAGSDRWREARAFVQDRWRLTA
jgi:hypothetical protein